MTPTQTLNKIDRNHAINVFLLLMLAHGLFVLFFIAPSLHYIHKSTTVFLTSIIAYGLGNIIIFVMYLFVRDSLIHLYLKMRGYHFDVDALDSEKLGKIIAQILHERGFDFKSNPHESVYFACWIKSAMNTKSHLQKMRLDSLCETITLNEDEASRVMLGLCPRGGSWAIWVQATFRFKINLQVMSAHERMMIKKQKSLSPL